MEKVLNNRQSNIELLRILAILGIIIHHITVHCIFIQLTDVDSILQMNNAFFCNPEIYPQLWLVDIGALLGSVGDELFILISGYFLIEKMTVSISKTSTKLISQCLFSAVIVVVMIFIYHFTGMSDNDIYLAGMEASVSPARLEFFNKSFWFIGYYFLIFIIAAVFLIRFLNNLTKKQYLEFILILFGIIEFSFTRELINSISSSLSTLLAGIFIFSLGGYIRKYDPFSRFKTVFLVFGIVITLSTVCFSTIYCRLLDIEGYIKTASEFSYIQTTYIMGLHNILVIINTVLLFELFKRLRLKQSRVINNLGAATFMCYLIHDNEFFYTIWYKYDWIKALFYNPFEFVCNLITISLITFAFGVLMYFLYKLIYDGIRIFVSHSIKQ